MPTKASKQCLDVRFFWRLDFIKIDLQRSPQSIHRDDHRLLKPVPTLIVVEPPKCEQHEGLIFIKSAQQKTGLGARPRLKNRVLIIDDQLQSKRREVVFEVSPLVIAREQKQIASATFVTLQLSPAQ